MAENFVVPYLHFESATSIMASLPKTSSLTTENTQVQESGKKKQEEPQVSMELQAGQLAAAETEKAPASTSDPPPPPNGGLAAWLNVFGAFLFVLNSWSVPSALK